MARDPEWVSRCRAQVDQVLEKHRDSADECRLDILKRLTLQTWETDLSLIDMTLKETLRFTMSGATVRKNISGKDVKVMGTDRVIPPGSVVVYSSADVHFAPDIYVDPHTWNPRRHEGHIAEGVDVPHSFLGWGGGHHPCRKFALPCLASSFFER